MSRPGEKRRWRLVPTATLKHWGTIMTDKPEAVPMTCSRPEAAAYLGISTRTFDRIQKSRVIAYVWVGQRRRYLLSDLQNYIKSNRTI